MIAGRRSHEMHGGLIGWVVPVIDWYVGTTAAMIVVILLPPVLGVLVDLFELHTYFGRFLRKRNPCVPAQSPIGPWAGESAMGINLSVKKKKKKKQVMQHSYETI